MRSTTLNYVNKVILILGLGHEKGIDCLSRADMGARGDYNSLNAALLFLKRVGFVEEIRSQRLHHGSGIKCYRLTPRGLEDFYGQKKEIIQPILEAQH